MNENELQKIGDDESDGVGNEVVPARCERQCNAEIDAKSERSDERVSQERADMFRAPKASDHRCSSIRASRRTTRSSAAAKKISLASDCGTYP